MKLDGRRLKAVLACIVVGVLLLALAATASAKTVDYTGGYGSAESADGGQLWLTVTTSRAKAGDAYNLQYSSKCGNRSIKFRLARGSTAFTVTQPYRDNLVLRVKVVGRRAAFTGRRAAISGTVRAHFSKRAKARCDTGTRRFRAGREPAPRAPTELWTPDFS